MAEKVYEEERERGDDDGDRVIVLVWRLRDRTLDYTSLITHFEDDESLKMKEGREGGRETEQRVWENN